MKLIDWILGLFGKKEEEIDPQKLDAWPFPVVLGTPPSCTKLRVKKTRPLPSKATIAKAAAKKSIAAKKPAVKKTTKKAK